MLVGNSEVIFENISFMLTLFRMSVFGAAHGWEGGGLPKICHTYPTKMKLGTFVP